MACAGMSLSKVMQPPLYSPAKSAAAHRQQLQATGQGCYAKSASEARTRLFCLPSQPDGVYAGALALQNRSADNLLRQKQTRCRDIWLAPGSPSVLRMLRSSCIGPMYDGLPGWALCSCCRILSMSTGVEMRVCTAPENIPTTVHTAFCCSAAELLMWQ